MPISWLSAPRQSLGDLEPPRHRPPARPVPPPALVSPDFPFLTFLT